MSVSIVFQDKSTPGPSGPITAWSWDFGDGGTSILENPTHIYAAGGTYNVTLIVTGTSPDGTQSITIPVRAGNTLSAGFRDSVSGLAATFTDLSIAGPSGPITAWAWDFGDGNTSTSQNPSHTYSSYGTYTVKLTITGTGIDGTSTSLGTVTLSNPAGPLAAAFAESISGLAVTFMDNSVSGPSGPITAWAWNFGDSNTSTSQNPSHTYASAGTRTVSLTVTGTSPDGTSSTSQNVTVSSSPPSSGCYWGARMNGTVYQTYYGAPNNHYAPWAAADAHPNTWDRFETHAGKKVCSVQWAGPTHGQSFPASTAALTQSRGAFNHYDLGATASQMASLAAGTDPSGVFAALATAIGSFGHPLMLRPFWEMNGNWSGDANGAWSWQVANGTPIVTYVAAFKKLVDIVRAHAPNASIMWCPNQMGSDPTPWFPGTSYCDWIGFDSYNMGSNQGPDALFNTTLAKIKSLAPGLPIGIGETGCRAPTSYLGGKSSWVTAFFVWLKAHPEVKWFSWYNDGNFSTNNYIEIGNASGQTSSTAMAAWTNGIADSRYIQAPTGGWPLGTKIPIPT